MECGFYTAANTVNWFVQNWLLVITPILMMPENKQEILYMHAIKYIHFLGTAK